MRERKKKTKEEQEAEMLRLFDKLEVNMPLLTLVKQMPKYAKFLKDLCTTKRNQREQTCISLSHNVSALYSATLPTKCTDQGSCTIPCQIGTHKFAHALLDLGAAINVMPHSILNSLGISSLQPTSVILQLADRTTRKPLGFLEDVLIKVKNLVFPADFYVLEMHRDKQVEEPLILGRPFLWTAQTTISLKEGTITMEVNNQVITFNVNEAMKHPYTDTSLLGINCIDQMIEEARDEVEESLGSCYESNAYEMQVEYKEAKERNKEELEPLEKLFKPQSEQILPQEKGLEELDFMEPSLHNQGKIEALNTSIESEIQVLELKTIEISKDEFLELDSTSLDTFAEFSEPILKVNAATRTLPQATSVYSSSMLQDCQGTLVEDIHDEIEGELFAANSETAAESWLNGLESDLRLLDSTKLSLMDSYIDTYIEAYLGLPQTSISLESKKDYEVEILYGQDTFLLMANPIQANPPMEHSCVAEFESTQDQGFMGNNIDDSTSLHCHEDEGTKSGQKLHAHWAEQLHYIAWFEEEPDEHNSQLFQSLTDDELEIYILPVALAPFRFAQTEKEVLPHLIPPRPTYFYASTKPP